MNSRIMKAVIKRKFNEWLATIKDPNLYKLVQENTIITGGCIASMLLKEKVNDFDLYFRTKETAYKVAKYYIDFFNKLHHNNPKNPKIGKPYAEEDGTGRIRVIVKSAGVTSENTDESQYQYFEQRPIEEGEEYIDQVLQDNLEGADELDGTKLDDEKPKYRPVFLTSNAITLSNKIQIIIRFYGDPEEIHKNYDYVHCTNYWTSWEGKLVLRKEALESLLTKQLYYVGSKYPLCSIIRMRKFIKKGWHINAGQILKICAQVSKLNLSDVNVLEDQLTGVDTMYFMQVIDYFKKKQEKDENYQIEMPYLISIIDRIFG